MAEKYQFTEDMDEISGFGGGYEEACRKMVLAGIKWLEENPNKNPVIKGFKNVVGLTLPDNEDAEEFQNIVANAADDNGGATGAMVQFAIDHAFWIKAHSWDEYVKMMKARKRR